MLKFWEKKIFSSHLYFNPQSSHLSKNRAVSLLFNKIFTFHRMYSYTSMIKSNIFEPDCLSPNPDVLLNCCVTVSSLQNFSVPQFSHLWNGYGWLWWHSPVVAAIRDTETGCCLYPGIWGYPRWYNETSLFKNKLKWYNKIFNSLV